MSKDFSGLELALGSVLGWRDWDIDTDGRLKAITYSGSRSHWMPGENLAECHKWASKSEVGEQGDMSDSDYRQLKEEWKATHQMNDCEHGFYAYFDGNSQQYSGGPRVRGIIEGYGEVVIGTKGFRAMKAKILALSIAPHDGMWTLDEFFVSRLRANYPNVPVFGSELAMRAEFPCPAYVSEEAVL